ncbi:MAG: acetyl-CoA decarbonylase/synthase complex subunit gamma [Planctomycetes bacterium RBG_13_63_9]|nr:MAG: acetyl-CoA decarbonylase/synthase complex subunit gamma [Planctomycetes bacterium RBG_13_63_9]
MALTGLEIYRQLPKTNCKDCGFPTCLAFAMKMAAGQIPLDKCPHVTEEGKAALESASRPPIQLVTIGVDADEVKIGNETQLYRHEERFHRQTAVAVRISDTLDEAAIAQRAEAISRLCFERVGTQIRVNLVAIDNESGKADSLRKAAVLASEKSGLACVLMSADAGNLAKAAAALAGKRPLLYISDPSEAEAAAAVAKDNDCPLAIRAEGLDALAELTPKVNSAGVEQIVLDPGSRGLKATLEAHTRIRRLALKGFRPLGYPTIALTTESDPTMQAVEASTFVAKYAGVVVTDAIEPWQILPVLTTRQDIYIDPQKPVAVEPKLNQVGEAGADSPVLVTTNFSLSYYSVEGEVEASRVPTYILAVDTEGTSVLTAWASDKFNAETITQAIKKSGVEEKVSHRRLIMPGLVAVLSAGVEDESGWSVLIGPKEASSIPSYLKNQWKA